MQRNTGLRKLWETNLGTPVVDGILVVDLPSQALDHSRRRPDDLVLFLLVRHLVQDRLTGRISDEEQQWKADATLRTTHDDGMGVNPSQGLAAVTGMNESRGISGKRNSRSNNRKNVPKKKKKLMCKYVQKRKTRQTSSLEKTEKRGGGRHLQ